jgi:hypothetical protein
MVWLLLVPMSTVEFILLFSDVDKQSDLSDVQIARRTLRSGWDDIKLDLKDINWEDLHVTDMVRDRDKWTFLV